MGELVGDRRRETEKEREKDTERGGGLNRCSKIYTYNDYESAVLGVLRKFSKVSFL